MFKLTSKGSFKNLEKLLSNCLRKDYKSVLEKYGVEGVQALSAATPVDTGRTASSWEYQIVDYKGAVSVTWYNTNIKDGVNIAIILQYGHGTRNGGYVSGTDYINPALKPIFDKIADAAWKEVIGS